MNPFQPKQQQPAARSMTRRLTWREMFERAFAGIQNMDIENDKLIADNKRLMADATTHLERINELNQQVRRLRRENAAMHEGQKAGNGPKTSVSSELVLQVENSPKNAVGASYAATEATSVSALEAHYDAALKVKDAQIEAKAAQMDKLYEWGQDVYRYCVQREYDLGLNLIARNAPECVKGGEVDSFITELAADLGVTADELVRYAHESVGSESNAT